VLVIRVHLKQIAVTAPRFILYPLRTGELTGFATVYVRTTTTVMHMSQSGTQESETDPESSYVSGKYLNENVLEDREYQAELAETSLKESTLVALPTGTGKTAVAARLIARRLEEHQGKVLMMAPTQPLVNQHARFFREVLSIPDHEIKVFTGNVPPDERQELWDGATSVILATPQVIENDLIGNRYSMNDVVHIIFDECHRATADYAYNYIGERYHGNAEHPLATGLSASPGSSKDKILEVCSNLGLTNVEVLTEDDDILKEYLHDTQIDYRWIDVPEELTEARDLVQEIYVDRLQSLKNDFNVLDSASKSLSFGKLNKARGKIQGMIDNDNSKGYKAQSVHAEALKLRHGWKTIETQSVQASLSYFEKILEEGRSSSGSKAAERIASSPQITTAIKKLREYDDVHPKLSEVRIEVGRTLLDEGQALIFTESRETASRIVEFLDEGNINPVRFVGQNNKKNDQGMTQTEQKETLDEFRDGKYNVLVSTSVAEEGIDIPAVDLVLFYEPVPNAVRTVQRRGRTGRQTQGRVVILIAKDTGDETSYYVSQRREKKMKTQLKKLKEMEEDLRDELREEQASLAEFGERFTDTDQPVVFLDSRETKSTVGKELDRMSGVTVNLETLDVADYVVSDRVAIERKELDDFIDSLISGDRDIFQQITELTNSYDRPVLLIEGANSAEGLYGRAQIDEEAIRSTLGSIMIDFDVSIYFTPDAKETANTVRMLARREQEENDREVNRHGRKSTDTMSETQEYIVSSIPDIGPVLAADLLDECGSVQGVVNASVEDLIEIEGVGEKTAKTINEVSTADYTDE